MRKVVRLTESDLVRIVKRVIKENKRFGSFDDEEWYDDTDRLTSKDDLDFDYDEEEFDDFDSYHGKYPSDSEDSPSWFKSKDKNYSKSMFDMYKDKHKRPFKVRTRRDDLNESYDIDAILNPRSIKYSENPNVDDFLESVFPGLNTEDTKKALFKLLRNEELFREFSRLMRIFGYNSYHNKEEIFDKVIEWAYERGYPEEEY